MTFISRPYSTKSPAGLNRISQFAHLEMAAPARSSSRIAKARKWTVEDLVAEADRKPNASRHVQHPQPPVWLIGSASETIRRAHVWHGQATEAGGRAKLRKTSPCLAAAVISWPDNSRLGWEAYRNDVIRYFEGKFGDRVCGVVEHRDESHVHIHVFFVPAFHESFGAVHPGYEARRLARLEEGNHVRVAYTAAMRKWQDELHEATGRSHGLARVGPARMRLSRPEFVRKQRDEALASAQRDREVAAQKLRDAEHQLALLDKRKAIELDEYRSRKEELSLLKTEVERARRDATTTLAAAEALKSQADAQSSKNAKLIELLTWKEARLVSTPEGALAAELDLERKAKAQLEEQVRGLQSRLDAADLRQRFSDEANRRTPKPGPR